MKKSPVFSALLVLSLFSFSAFFSSCSSSDQETDSNEETSTLRYEANQLYDSIIWTEELEVDRLSTKVNSTAGISSKLNLTPLIVLAGVQSESSRVFPSLGSFGSLDTTLIPKPLKETINSFSDCIAKYKDADSYMEKECLYSLALFYTDFKRIFKDCLELDKPDEKAAENAEKTDEKTEEKTETAPAPADAEKSEEAKADSTAPEAEESKVPEKAYFSSFKVGQPFLDGTYYQVPVKFFSDKATLTLCLFCSEKNGSWKIDQVQISDLEIFNGEN